MRDTLPLDPLISGWVLLPIVFVMFFVPLLRYHVAGWLLVDKKTKFKDMADKHVLARATLLKSNRRVLLATAFDQRRAFLTDDESGMLKREIEAYNPLTSMMDPSNGLEMMKKNISMVLSQILLMGWVNHFFSGFVVVKLPFPLTLSFRPMLQRGIDLATLDVSYVSALSWYFLNLFGLQGLTSLAIQTQAPQSSTATLARDATATPNISDMNLKPMFDRTIDDLLLVEHSDAECVLSGVEARLLSRECTF
eukprot:TRINITY_DN10281_c0_g1_i1.p1 TRINITY_DN10281_c0_g1~~TRINITY_DN10281_c0_g1_i1.p1  ORF type:complete len:251 (+),score=80.33 TRINITY_DN10281_c0_g1_i1:145-897(+)